MATELSAPPVLSTPDDHILEVPTPAATQTTTLSDDALRSVYEIDRTATEVRAGGWSRVALQFPDDMLVDAPRVSEALAAELASTSRVYILGDTSYSACCVDEVAAEHADADVVVHYGRACLSPTARLPVVYVYTSRDLDVAAAADRFEAEFADRHARVVLMADLMYQHHVEPLADELRRRGYVEALSTEVVRDPTGLVPNRRIRGAGAEAMDAEGLKAYSLFHISDPPTSVLLSLHSRFASLHVLGTTPPHDVENPTARTAGLLRRRFARVLTLASAGVVGILVNTLSVANSLASVDRLRRACDAAGKKSYTVVVGRLNPAKLANFAEVEGWVVVGCWEAGLVDEDQAGGGYWRPVVTPFEMEVALTSEDRRTWGGEWWGGIEKLTLGGGGGDDEHVEERRIEVREDDDDVDEDESLPPEFDLRTGRLVSHSRPMRTAAAARGGRGGSGADDDEVAGRKGAEKTTTTLVRRAGPGEVASINGVASPGAEFLRSQRTWQGLGSDFAENQDETSTLVEEGRSGIARGYQVGEGERH